MGVSSHTITIDENGILNTTSFDRAISIQSFTKHVTLNCKKDPTSLDDSTTKDSMEENTKQSSTMNDE